jgi:hypothetical protein
LSGGWFSDCFFSPRAPRGQDAKTPRVWLLLEEAVHGSDDAFFHQDFVEVE